MAEALLKKNIFANIIGKAISGLATIMFVPWFVKLLGSEAYGVISLATTIQLFIFIVDMGFSGAFTREIAQTVGRARDDLYLANLHATFEKLFLAGGLGVSLTILCSSWFIAVHWLRPEHISVQTLVYSIILIGIITGFQFCFLIYQGGLLGHQRLVTLNGILVVSALLRTVGTLLVIIFWKRTIIAYFTCQLVISALQFLAGRALFWRIVPVGNSGKFTLDIIKPLLKFSLGMAGIGISGLVLMNLDKVILSKMLPLKSLGLYALAGMPGPVPLRGR